MGTATAQERQLMRRLSRATPEPITNACRVTPPVRADVELTSYRPGGRSNIENRPETLRTVPMTRPLCDTVTVASVGRPAPSVTAPETQRRFPCPRLRPAATVVEARRVVVVRDVEVGVRPWSDGFVRVVVTTRGCVTPVRTVDVRRVVVVVRGVVPVRVLVPVLVVPVRVVVVPVRVFTTALFIGTRRWVTVAFVPWTRVVFATVAARVRIARVAVRPARTKRLVGAGARSRTGCSVADQFPAGTASVQRPPTVRQVRRPPGPESVTVPSVGRPAESVIRTLTLPFWACTGGASPTMSEAAIRDRKKIRITPRSIGPA